MINIGTWRTVDTPGVLGVRFANWMVLVKIRMAAAQLNGDKKRGEGEAPHLGSGPFWHG